ncbi:uncharacterized protein J7T54_008542 [Emericellopsis cladophorae]|uniref:Uncharacterized protein n=1 Tax=Emericellopsis cladophorae TaxID=2686198 RepID=A0A9P9XZW1_9HYPO|nr:uncharacterized protein J7T54_008542 [Emericellopsis cladophorae]KAI6780623.1 hypothetical protein J7T54_008542 [Emericellopsis cladophorae]
MVMLHHTAALLLILLCTVATLTNAKCTQLDKLSREIGDWCSKHLLGKDPDPSVHYSLPAGQPWRPTMVDVCQDMPDPAVCQVLHYDVPSHYVPFWWNGPWSVSFPVWRRQDEKDLKWQLFFGNSNGAQKFNKKDFRFHTIVNNGTDDLQIAHTVRAWYHKSKVKGRPVLLGRKYVTPTGTRRVLYFEFQDVIVRPVVKREDGVSVSVLGDVLLHWKLRDCSQRIPIFRIGLVQAEYLDGAEMKKANFFGVPAEHRYFVNK